MTDLLASDLSWFILGLVLMLGELVTPGFIIIFFGFGAWLVSLLTWMGVVQSFQSQLIIFIVSSLLFLVVFRKYLKQYSQGKVISADEKKLDRFVGEKAVVTKDIVSNSLEGKVELHGTQWSAQSEQTIVKGTIVEVVKQENLVLIVKSLN